MFDLSFSRLILRRQSNVLSTILDRSRVLIRFIAEKPLSQHTLVSAKLKHMLCKVSMTDNSSPLCLSHMALATSCKVTALAGLGGSVDFLSLEVCDVLGTNDA
jgi:hypothetical protein